MGSVASCTLGITKEEEYELTKMILIKNEYANINYANINYVNIKKIY